MVFYVIGFIGSDRFTLAKTLSKKYSLPLYDMDKDIVRIDGRSLLRLCMTMGEHEYRNKEYELLLEYSNLPQGVVVCGDGVVLDAQSRELLSQGKVFVAEQCPETLWQSALTDKSLPYAFLHVGTEAEQKAKFMELYWARKPLYDSFL